MQYYHFFLTFPSFCFYSLPFLPFSWPFRFPLLLFAFYMMEGELVGTEGKPTCVVIDEHGVRRLVDSPHSKEHISLVVVPGPRTNLARVKSDDATKSRQRTRLARVKSKAGRVKKSCLVCKDWLDAQKRTKTFIFFASLHALVEGVLFVADIFTDIRSAITLLALGHVWWGRIILVSLVIPLLTAYAGLIRYPGVRSKARRYVVKKD